LESHASKDLGGGWTQIKKIGVTSGHTRGGKLRSQTKEMTFRRICQKKQINKRKRNNWYNLRGGGNGV